MELKRILFVAYEPWETRLGSSFLSRVSKEADGIESLLVVADPWQVVDKASLADLGVIQESALHPTTLIFKNLAEWQEKISSAEASEVSERLDKISSNEGLADLEGIMRSDVHFFPRERTPYYPPISGAEIRSAAVLVFDECLQTLDRFQPDVLVMIGEQYLAKNFFAAVAQTRNIPIRVFRGLRFQNFLKCDSFFLGASGEGTKKEKDGPYDYIRDLQNFDFTNSLYSQHLASSDKERLAVLKSKKLRAPIGLLIGFASETVRTVVLRWLLFWSPAHDSKKSIFTSVRYWHSSEWRTEVWRFMRVIRMILYAWRRWPFVQPNEIPTRYFLVPLHLRPESSTLTFGRNLEEEDFVDAIAGALTRINSEISCVLLENPSMVGDRRQAFYRRLLRHLNVIFVDPTVSTQVLVQQSLGVLTISGTVALEASLRGVPVHVMGTPDYLEAIDSHGANKLTVFLEKCISGDGPSSRGRVLSYLLEKSSKNFKGNLDWNSSLPENIDATTDTLLEMFWASLHRKRNF